MSKLQGKHQMSITIGSNIAAFNAERHMAENTSRLSKVSERLSSGLRINTASDDAAGLSIAETLRADARVYAQGIRNVSDGISAITIAQGALLQLSNVVTRQKELAEQAANGVYSLSQRRALHTEANALVDEFNRIVETTSFNGQKLLDGSLSDLRLQLGYGVDGSLKVGLSTALARNAGTGEFYQAGSYVAGTSTGVVTADLNHDGIADLISSRTTAGSRGLEVFLGNADGTFGAATTFGGSEWSADLAVGDLNGDGNADIINSVGAGNVVRVYMGNGDGSFQSSVSYASYAFMRGGVIGDVNGDGIPDFVAGASNPADDMINVFLGNGDGTLRAAVSYTTGYGSNIGGNIEIGDFNGDGRNEIVASLAATSRVLVLSSDATGNLSVSQDLSSGGGPRGTTIGDFNEDGYLDFAAISQIDSAIDVFINKGDGTFNSRVSYATGSATSSSQVKSVDIDGDGKVDLITTNTTGVSVHFGNGDGTFRGPISTSLALGVPPAGIAVADFNRDGAIDVAGISAIGAMVVDYARTTKESDIGRLYLLSQSGAMQALNTTTQTLDRIALELGVIGSHQARLSVAAHKLMVERENYLAAESRIRDADIAHEAADLVRMQILQKVGAAVLSQANLQPDIAVTLLS